jgi:hypothetical protein
MKTTRLSTFIVFLPARTATASAYLSWSAFDLTPRPCANQISPGDRPEIVPHGYTMGNDSSISVYTDSWGMQCCISWRLRCPHDLADDSLFFGTQAPCYILSVYPSLAVKNTFITVLDVDNVTSRPNGFVTFTGV